jgi:3-oxoacyl-[acyl-carrier protein] reductase
MKAPITVITGSSRGIGQQMALYYLTKGHIVVGCSRGAATIDHAQYFHYPLDVADENAVVSLMKDVRKTHGGIDHLINNAGIASMNHAMLTPAATVQNIFSTNVLGTFLFSREAAKIMMRKKQGRIVNFSTVAVPLNLEGEATYAASKAAVESLTKILAREFSLHGITVNAVGPTPIDTDLIKGVPMDKIDDLVKRQAIPRKGTFTDVLNVVDFYLNPASEFITGQVIYLGGVS